MEVDDAMGEVPQSPEYSDERRKKELLPPEEEWAPAIRPPIKGKVKILDDRILVDQRVKLVDPNR